LNSCCGSKIQVCVANDTTFIETCVNINSVATFVHGASNEVSVEEWCGKRTNVAVSNSCGAKIFGVVNMVFFAGEPPVGGKLVLVEVCLVNIIKVNRLR